MNSKNSYSLIDFDSCWNPQEEKDLSVLMTKGNKRKYKGLLGLSPFDRSLL